MEVLLLALLFFPKKPERIKTKRQRKQTKAKKHLPHAVFLSLKKKKKERQSIKTETEFIIPESFNPSRATYCWFNFNSDLSFINSEWKGLSFFIKTASKDIM